MLKPVAARAFWARPLYAALLVGVLFRIGVFVYAALWPLPDESSAPVSAFSVQSGIDFHFYLEAAETYASLSLVGVLEDFLAFYEEPFSKQLGYVIAGPVFPMLIWLFDYSPGTTLPLALLYLAMGIAMVTFWLRWLDARGVPGPWLFLFALLPNPIWLTLNISSDLPFAILFAAFYFVYFRERWSAGGIAIWIGLLGLVALTRPNGYALVLFVAIDLLFRSGWRPSTRFIAVGFSGLAVVVFGLYLYPYFITTVRVAAASPDTVFFGIPQSEYVAGVLDGLPKWLDLVLSWVGLFGAKVLYFVGLRPSFAGVEWWIVVLRGAVGMALLPGLVYVALAADNRHRLLIALFILPILLGPAQDRYNLAIQPLLFFFGVRAYTSLWALMPKTVLHRIGASRRRLTKETEA